MAENYCPSARAVSWEANLGEDIDITCVNFTETLEELMEKVKSYKICFSNLTAELLEYELDGGT